MKYHFHVTFKINGRYEVINPVAANAQEAVVKAVEIAQRRGIITSTDPAGDVAALVYGNVGPIMLWGLAATAEVHE